MSEIIIRLQKDNEIEKIVDVFIDSFMPTKPDEVAKARIVKRFQLIKDYKITDFYVAELDAQIVGIGGLTIHKGSSFIGYIGVSPSYRKKGIGTKIFAELVEQANLHNPTQELFSNPGADTIYRKFGYKDDFTAHIYELTRSQDKKNFDGIEIYNKIPDWIYCIDKEAMGFDRSSFLNFLFNFPGTKLFGIPDEGYALDMVQMFGPIIAKSDETAYNLIDYNLNTGSKRIIASESFENKLEKFSPVIKQTCYKMSLGEPLKNKPYWIWSYNSFASS
ncbi:MAG: GNAT family N-acetyltransferase [Candidatus Thorarchaeota archaeon]